MAFTCRLTLVLNHLNPESDQRLVSPDSNIADSFNWDHENKGNDHQLKMLSFVKHILLVSTSGNVGTVWRMSY